MNLINILSSNWYMLKSIWKISKNRYTIELFNAIVNIINVVYTNIYLLKRIFDSIADRTSFYITAKYTMLFFLTRAFCYTFIYWYSNLYVPKSDLTIKEAIKEKTFKKLRHIDLICYDDPAFYNKKIWVCNDVENRCIQILNTFFGFINSILISVSAIVFALFLEPFLIVFAFILIIGSYFVNKKYIKVSFDFEKESVACKRRMEYPSSVFFSVAAAKDIRLTGLPLLLKKHHEEYIEKYMEMINSYGESKVRSYVVLLYVKLFFGSWIPLLFIATKAIMTKAYSVGTVIASISVINTMRDGVKSFSDAISEMQKHSMYIENYKNFMAMESEIKQNETGKRAANKANSIKLKHVSFKYPNMEKYVLKDVNMEINSGEKVAIVGHNGAGKTTLIKLIMRLYLPQEGNIYLDGEKEEEYNLDSLRGRFGVIFQDFQLYAMTVGENVLMDEDCESEEKKTVIDAALKSSGLYDRIYKEKNNINTSVLKEYDEEGLILSGGQAQKLAIARIFAKDCGVVIMDEPSSALDPISEHEMHKNMLEAAKDKTVILISHRLWTTKDVDRIYYFENGEIVEEGSHEELMQHNGQYAKMFHIQADKY